MSCPTCGSQQARPISAGVVECQGWVEQPTGRHPSGAFGPATEPAPCRTVYQVPLAGSPLGMCAHDPCGVQAIARCVECGSALCLRHGPGTPVGVLCERHANERQQRLRRESARASASATERLLRALREFPAAVAGREGDLLLEHDIRDRGWLRRATPGTACPEHGDRCRVARVVTKGLLRRPLWADLSEPAWVLMHHCRVTHRDLHGDGHFEGEAVVITAGGELSRLYSIRPPRLMPTARYSSSRQLLTAEAFERPAGGSGSARARRELADRLEQVMAGGGRLGSLPCDPRDFNSLSFW